MTTHTENVSLRGHNATAQSLIQIIPLGTKFFHEDPFGDYSHILVSKVRVITPVNECCESVEGKTVHTHYYLVTRNAPVLKLIDEETFRRFAIASFTNTAQGHETSKIDFNR